jgi:PadR family transcriptional regulator PadR
MERMTYATAMVLQALGAGYRYGFDIADATELRGGTVYPILRRLERDGVIASKWEDARISRGAGRPARKYYRLLARSRALVELARSRFPFSPLRVRGDDAEVVG